MAEVTKPRGVELHADNHARRNPRVIKGKSAMQVAGHKAEVFGDRVDPLLKHHDQELVTNLRFKFDRLHYVTEHSAARGVARIREKLGLS